MQMEKEAVVSMRDACNANVDCLQSFMGRSRGVCIHVVKRFHDGAFSLKARPGAAVTQVENESSQFLQSLIFHEGLCE